MVDYCSTANSYLLWIHSYRWDIHPMMEPAQLDVRYSNVQATAWLSNKRSLKLWCNKLWPYCRTCVVLPNVPQSSSPKFIGKHLILTSRNGSDLRNVSATNCSQSTRVWCPHGIALYPNSTLVRFKDIHCGCLSDSGIPLATKCYNFF